MTHQKSVHSWLTITQKPCFINWMSNFFWLLILWQDHFKHTLLSGHSKYTTIKWKQFSYCINRLCILPCAFRLSNLCNGLSPINAVTKLFQTADYTQSTGEKWIFVCWSAEAINNYTTMDCLVFHHSSFIFPVSYFSSKDFYIKLLHIKAQTNKTEATSQLPVRSELMGRHKLEVAFDRLHLTSTAYFPICDLLISLLSLLTIFLS